MQTFSFKCYDRHVSTQKKRSSRGILKIQEKVGKINGDYSKMLCVSRVEKNCRRILGALVPCHCGELCLASSNEMIILI